MFAFGSPERGQGNSFVLKEPALDVLTERETRQRTIRADDPMAGHKKADGVRSIGTAHCPRSPRLAELPGEFAVRTRFAQGNPLQRSPDFLLKRRAARSECNG